MNIVTKNGGKKSEKKNFTRIIRISRTKNNRKKSRLEKVRKHVIYKHTNIMTKKFGKKTRENFFPETLVYREVKTMEKYRLEKVRKHVFFMKTRIS